MSHAFHEGPEDAVLYDGCEECDSRASNPIDGLLNMDESTYDVLRQRMLEVEYAGVGHYLTTNETKVGKHLYYISVLEERHGPVRRIALN